MALSTVNYYILPEYLGTQCTAGGKPCILAELLKAAHCISLKSWEPAGQFCQNKEEINCLMKNVILWLRF